MQAIAIQFGKALDKDDFEACKELLASDCIYHIGDTTLSGPEEIVNSYEENMLAGRKKMDKLEWGESTIDHIKENEYMVNFTDYLYHKGEQYTHCCQQKLTINAEQKISKIEHIHDPDEQKRLNTWYDSVGIPRTSN